MNAFILIVPIVFAIVVSKIVIPPFVPSPRVAVRTVQITPAEYRQKLREQKWKDAMKVESLTEGGSE